MMTELAKALMEALWKAQAARHMMIPKMRLQSVRVARSDLAISIELLLVYS